MDKEFTVYEYTKIPVQRKNLHFLLDCYESLGWEQDNRLETDNQLLTLRRSRNLLNRMELTRLQGHLESCLSQIEVLEARSTSKATSAALASGIFGTILMALSVIVITAQPPRILLCILFGIPALGLWGYAPILYRRLLKTGTAAAAELIRQKQEEIFEICAKGRKLL